VLTLKSTLISLQSLLCSPEPNDPQDAEGPLHLFTTKRSCSHGRPFRNSVAKHYLSSRPSFEETARYWAEIYAGAPKAKKPAAGGSQTNTAESGSAAPKRDEIAIAGLQSQHVDQFVMLGFPQAKVVRRPVFNGFQIKRSLHAINFFLFLLCIRSRY
jgi:ubiquitin-conjugating enzyme (huntingtin interacting protein 2)